MDARQRHGLKDPPGASISPQSDYNPNTRNYGIRPGGIARRGLRGNFVPPVRNNGGNAGNMISSRVSGKCDDSLEDSTRKWLVTLHSSLAIIFFCINLFLFWHNIVVIRPKKSPGQAGPGLRLSEIQPVQNLCS